MNLFLTDDGVLKLGYYGLVSQSECFSIKNWDCDGVRSFAPEVLKRVFKLKSDVWSFGISLIEMMGMTPYYECETNHLPAVYNRNALPFHKSEINSADLIVFLHKCFKMDVYERWSVSELMNVSVT